jgi:quinoprotein glucose dehydrogenase
MIIRRGFALFLLVIGLILLAGGGELLWLGGSPFYLLDGLALAASAVLVWRGDRRGLWLYAAFFVVTVAWALWEAGLDGWALNARLTAPAILGLGFLLPPVDKGLTRPERGKRWTRWPIFVAGLGIAALLGTLLHGATAQPADPIYQVGARTAPAAGSDRLARSGDWLQYGNDAGGTRYSTLDQITPGNVGKLQLAWTVHVGGLPNDGKEKIEATPLKVGANVYICTGYNDILSIDAESGRVNWRFHAKVDPKQILSGACRGVVYFQVPNATGKCATRIIEATVDGRLLAVDAADGKPCASFGAAGQTSLLTGMGDVGPGYYMVTSAPALVRGKLVVGGWVLDGQYWGEPSGVIRAYDAVTGKFAWAFDMGRPDDHAEPKPGTSYTRATPNSWAPMSADETLGLVYVPTGNATPDYYGGRRRPFDDKYSSSVLAIDAETGALRWSFQTAHHDLWDYDVASQPTLIDLPSPGGIQHALIQPTKRGEIFVLDRATGRPLRPVREKPAPLGGTAPQERPSPTQPFSDAMPSFRGALLRESDMWGLTPIDQLYCRILFKRARYDGSATPPGLDRPIVIWPGTMGGMDWGGVSIDRSRMVMIVNSNRVGNYLQLMPRSAADKMGLQPYGEGPPRSMIGALPQSQTPYAANMRPFLSPLYAPCTKPPFGQLTAIDLRSGKVIWSKPLGTARDSGPLGIPSMLPITMGVPTLGGSLSTRSGLVFIGATIERSFRAIDVRTGKELWQARLPGGGHASPMTYWSAKSGRQFVVLAAGGAPLLGSQPSDAIVAYALPRSTK